MSKNNSLNNITLKAGNIEKDATSGTEIVNWRSMRNAAATSFSVSSAAAPGERLLRDGATTANGDVFLRALIPGNFIGIEETDDELIISGSAGTGGNVQDFTAVGGQFSLLQGIGTLTDPGPTITLKNLVAGDNFRIVGTNDQLQLYSSAGNNAGTVETFTSPVSGTSLLEGGVTSTSEPVVRFRSLVPGTNITMTPTNDSGDNIKITSTAGSVGGGTLTTVNAVGGGKSLLFGVGETTALGPVVTTKTLLQGANITLTENAQFITIDSAASAGTGTVSTFTAVGLNPLINPTAVSLLDGGVASISGATIDLKTLVAGDNVTFDTDMNTLTINAGATVTLGKTFGIIRDTSLTIDNQLRVPSLPATTVLTTAEGGRNLYNGRDRAVGARTFDFSDTFRDVSGAIANNRGQIALNNLGRSIRVNVSNLNFRIEINARVLLYTRTFFSGSNWAQTSLIVGVYNNTTGIRRNVIVDTFNVVTRKRFISIGAGLQDGASYEWLEGTAVFDNFRARDDGLGSEYFAQAGQVFEPYVDFELARSRDGNGLNLEVFTVDNGHLNYNITVY